jgi:ATP-dependent helicase/nuclease subunit B
VSEFSPVSCELQVGSGGVPPLQIPLADGGFVGVRGVVDRVDCLEKDGEYYIRVVDYKTYNKTFTRADVEKGLDTQMLLYLYSLCESQDEALRKELNLPEGVEPKPAGILYLNVGTSGIPKNAADTPDRMNGYFGASGLLLSDEEQTILRAMEPDLGGKYIPIKLDRHGKISRGSQKSMADADEFVALREEIADVVGAFGQQIRDGIADAAPLSDAKHDGCEYCKMRAVCRRRKE